MKKIMLAALAVVATVSCADTESFDGGVPSGNKELSFTSGIESRVSGNQWANGDKIGIFCYDNVSEQYTNSNVEYRADQAGAMTSFSVYGEIKPICLPKTPTYSCSIRAYYPYTSEFGDDCIIDISDQSDLSAIDYMVAETAISNSDENPTQVSFSFKRCMALVKFNIKAKESIESLSELAFQIESITVFDNLGLDLPAGSATRIVPSPTLPDGSVVEASGIEVASDGKSATVEMILFPRAEGETTESTLRLSLAGESHSAPFATSLTAGKQHNFDVEIGVDGIAISGATITDWEASADNDDITTTLK